MSRALTIAIAWLVSAGAARADDGALEVHGQATYVQQVKPGLDSPYEGTNSLRGARERGYTLTATMFLGARLPEGTELYLNPEIVQGVGFSGLHGLGGFANGEFQRGAGPDLKGYRARLFLRHAWNLGGDSEEQESEANQVRTRYAAERVVLTAGNVSVLDVFDALDYSRDARTQFMNWSSLTYGAWDYAADARGYTWGAALEYISPGWQLRAGRFLVPVESNGLRLDRHFTQRYGDVAELEVPYRFGRRPAVVRALVFRNRVHAGAFEDALALGASNGTAPDLTRVRRDQSKSGVGLSTQVEVTPSLGAYVRAGWSDGRTETFMFTEIDRSVSAGVLARGDGWGRPKDSVGAALYVNGLSGAHRAYLAAGGLGFFLGDGRMNYASERIFETFYSLGVVRGAWFSLDYQHVENPGYNADRGPANFLGFRIHGEI
ncbi:MAG TPA: carbohydrate porin [Burkholderiales bacterium]|nr:carbohydrate porin [Burkholderiales bacterium]